jgi:hypothetical protein
MYDMMSIVDTYATDAHAHTHIHATTRPTKTRRQRMSRVLLLIALLLVGALANSLEYTGLFEAEQLYEYAQHSRNPARSATQTPCNVFFDQRAGQVKKKQRNYRLARRAAPPDALSHPIVHHSLRRIMFLLRYPFLCCLLTCRMSLALTVFVFCQT